MIEAELVPNLERIALLADALDSGEFDQGRGMLRTADDHYCCLGVACELARRAGAVGDWEPFGPTWIIGNMSTELPRAVMEWYGFGVNNPYLHAVDRSMIGANDQLKFTFPQIATALRATYGIPQPEEA